MKPINTSIFDFPELIRRGCVYVDKTGILYEIAKPDADGIYYLPRPRRFGKSLMISTLKIPNHEVRQSLEQGYISRLLGKDFQIDNFRFTAESAVGG